MKKIITLIVVLFLLASATPAQAKAEPLTILSVSSATAPITIKGVLRCSDYVAVSKVAITADRVNVSVVAKDTQPLRGCILANRLFSLSLSPAIQAGVSYKVYVNGVYYFNIRKPK